MRKKLFEVIGIDKKTKVETNAFVIAASSEEAVSVCSFLENPKYTGREEEVGDGWQER